MEAKSKTIAIIQARMNSTRLPGKVLMDISGKPMLWHIIERAKKSKKVNSIIVATTKRKQDKAIIALSKQCNVNSFAGSERNVLDRYYQAAKKFNADIIVRITGDCPLINPFTVDNMVNLCLKKNAENICVDSTIPSIEQGIDVISFFALKKVKNLAKKDYQKEHIIIFIQENPKLFKIKTIKPKSIFQRTDMRLTVDTKNDLKLMREIYKKLYKKGEIINLKDVVKLLDNNPKLKEINRSAKISKINKYSILLQKKIMNSLKLKNTKCLKKK